MLEFFRNMSNSLIAKIMLGLIALSFIVVGGFATSSSSNTVATVGNQKISIADFQREYQYRLRTGGLQGMPKEELKQLNFARAVLDNLIAITAIQAEIKKLNITVSDSKIAQEIRKSDFFQTDGKFDKLKFESLLESNRLTKESYIEILRKDLTNRRYNSVFNGIDFIAPNISKLLGNYINQRRNGIQASKKFSQVKIKKIPDAVIKKFYTDNKELFKVEQKRDVSVLHFNPTVLAKSIPDKRAKTYYNTHIEQYTIPEKRSFYQFTGNKSTLTKLKKAIDSGKNIKKSVKKYLKINAEDALKESVTKANTVPDIRQIVFKAKKGKTTNIFNSVFNTSLIYVTKITKKSKKPFKTVKATIKQEIAAEETFNYTNTADESISTGATLEEVAKQVNIKINKINKLSKNGDTAIFTQDPIFTDEIFKMETGEVSTLIELSDNSFVIVRIDTIHPAYTPIYKNVKKDAKEIVSNNKRQTIIDKQLKRLEKTKTKKTFLSVAKKLNFKTENIKDISRQQALQNTVTSLFFETDKNTATSTTDKNIGYAIFTTDINNPKKISTIQINELNKNIINLQKNNLAQFLNTYLRNKHGVTINNTLLNRVYE